MARKTKNESGKCANRGCTNDISPASKSGRCEACLAVAAENRRRAARANRRAAVPYNADGYRPCKRCGRNVCRGEHLTCNPCQNKVGRVCNVCGRDFQGRRPTCGTCWHRQQYGKRVHYKRVEICNHGMRDILDNDPERQARIARYTQMVEQGLPLFGESDRPRYIRSVRDGGPVSILGFYGGLGDE